MDPAATLTQLRDTLVSELAPTFKVRIAPPDGDFLFQLDLVLLACEGYWTVRLGKVEVSDGGFRGQYLIDLESYPLVVTTPGDILSAAREIVHRLEAEAAGFIRHQARARSAPPG